MSPERRLPAAGWSLDVAPIARVSPHHLKGMERQARERTIMAVARMAETEQKT
jgi:hypothetical protein